jgi:hypothetical protein
MARPYSLFGESSDSGPDEAQPVFLTYVVVCAVTVPILIGAIIFMLYCRSKAIKSRHFPSRNNDGITREADGNPTTTTTAQRHQSVPSPEAFILPDHNIHLHTSDVVNPMEAAGSEHDNDLDMEEIDFGVQTHVMTTPEVV